MPLNADRLFRRIWLVNGILFLVLLIGSVGLAGYGIMSGLWGREGGVQPTANGAGPSEHVRPRAIRYDEPERIVNSKWMLALVRYGTDYGKPSGGSLDLPSASKRRYDFGGPLANVAFLPSDGVPGRLLLDRPAYIQNLEFPRERRRYPDERIDSVPWITYAIAFEDTDGSGRLDSEDAAELYISELNGANFRRVLPAGFRVRSTQVLPDQHLLVTALDARSSERKPDDQLTQRAFRVDPRTGVMSGHSVLDSLATAAGRILGRP